MKLPVYMDYHATTPTDPRVLEVMLPYFTEHFGNAASRTHGFGWKAQEAVERAREQVADLIGAKASEIVFTSGATESDNLAVKGVAETLRASGNHIITVSTEHKAVLDSCHRLERDGCRVTFLPVAADGLLDPDTVRRAITDQTVLISVMAANGEVGVLQPIGAIGAIARAHGVLFHTDAVQAVGKIPFDVRELGVDLASITAHKMYGPKGVGALYVRNRRPRLTLAPIIDGGGHERGMRSGTLNVPGIVGLGKTAELCRTEMEAEASRLRQLRDRMLAELERRLEGVLVNGSMRERLPHNLNVSFEGIEGESLLLAVKDVALSTGSACSSGSAEPSYVLKALGLDDRRANASVRVGLGRYSTAEEAGYVVDGLVRAVTRLREMSPLAARSAGLA